jgi:UDP-N-acetyl-2-amino-2-deoxyglucuronate dehydrogenase
MDLPIAKASVIRASNIARSTMQKNFAIIGVGGYIAPRHLKAIKDTGGQLVAAVDNHDSVGILDHYDFNTRFFTEIERFDRHLEKLRRGPEENRVHYVSICSPNYLHDAHCRLALRVGANAICEKPLVINPWNLDALAEIERESGGKINTVLQLRTHPMLLKLRDELRSAPKKAKHEVCLTYITARGKWYSTSWKGSEEKSGGVAMNIGVHFFDMLIWLFGPVADSRVYYSNGIRTSGFLELETARVQWYLSIDQADLPFQISPGSKSTYRSITVDDREVEFTEGFGDLHTKIYEQVLAGKGFGIEETRPSIELVYRIRTSKLSPMDGYIHPYLKRLSSSK